MINFTHIRYYLELISIPVFAFLVIHLSGHGFSLLQNNFHGEHQEDLLSLNYLFSFEVLSGIIALAFFIWLWHLPFMKTLVPCAHDHCHHKTIFPHLLATGAFVFHFFPESRIRYELLSNINPESFFDIMVIIGFSSHFLVDIFVAVLISSFWRKNYQKFLSFFIITLFWINAFYFGKNAEINPETLNSSIVLIISAFLLAMFVHMPHKPKPPCGSCHSHKH